MVRDVCYTGRVGFSIYQDARLFSLSMLNGTEAVVPLMIKVVV